MRHSGGRGVVRFQGDLRLQTRAIATNRRDRERRFIRPEGDRGVALVEAAGNGDLVPRFRVADVADGNVVVPAPEERHGVETLPRSDLGAREDVAGRGLTHALCDDPMLHANAFPRSRIWIASGVPRGEDPGGARL